MKSHETNEESNSRNELQGAYYATSLAFSEITNKIAETEVFVPEVAIQLAKDFIAKDLEMSEISRKLAILDNDPETADECDFAILGFEVMIDAANRGNYSPLKRFIGDSGVGYIIHAISLNKKGRTKEAKTLISQGNGLRRLSKNLPGDYA